MGFFEKVKNMFTEEVEDDDVKVEQIKNEVTHVTIESPNAKDEDDEYSDTIIRETFTSGDTKAHKPIFFDDNDFKDLNLDSDEEEYNKNDNDTDDELKEEDIVAFKNSFEPEKELYPSKHYEKDLYNASKEETKKEEKKIFKPTPIISPIYGILDKNYHKEDIISRNDKVDKVKEEPAEPSIDSIRNKAYGTLEDELENTLFGTNSILFKKDNKKEEKEEDKEIKEIKEIDGDVLDNLTDDISKELDELLVKKEKYSDEEEKEENIDGDDLLEFIDSTLYKNGDEE